MPETPLPRPEGQSHPCLRIDLGDGSTSIFRIEAQRIAIGRSSENDVVLPDPRISRHQAEIRKRDDAYVLHDLGGINPVKVNGVSVKEAVLRHNDEIRIGPASLVFRAEVPGAPTAAEDDTLWDREDDFRGWRFQSIRVNAEDCSHLGIERAVAAATGSPWAGPEAAPAAPLPKASELRPDPTPASSLVQINKVLYVLYEISRQLVSFKDHKQLFGTVMDLIFKVVDADFGFLVLVDPRSSNPFQPLIAKYRDPKIRRSIQPKPSRTLINRVVEDRAALLTVDAQSDSRFHPAESLVRQMIHSSLCVPLWRKDEIIGVIQLNSIRMSHRFSKDDLELLTSIGCQMSMVLEQVSLNDKIREEERIRDWLARFHSPQVIEALLEARSEPEGGLLQASDRRATVLFADLSGFTRFAETITPREVTVFLNDYFSLVTDIVFEHGGTLDKYIGDGVMAVYGAPLEKRDHAESAVRSALKIRRELEQGRAMRDGARKFQVRIGINTGNLVAGSIGSPKRLEYTVIGDAVNVASRLESIAEPDQILIGEETYRSVGEGFRVREVGPRSLKGRSQDILVYEVLDER